MASAIPTKTTFLFAAETGYTAEVEHLDRPDIPGDLKEALELNFGLIVELIPSAAPAGRLIPGEMVHSDEALPYFTFSHLGRIATVLRGGAIPAESVPRPPHAVVGQDSDTWLTVVNVKLPRSYSATELAEALQEVYEAGGIAGSFYVGPVLPHASRNGSSAQVTFYRSLSEDSAVIEDRMRQRLKENYVEGQVTLEMLACQLYDELEASIDPVMHGTFVTGVQAAVSLYAARPC